MSGGFSVYSTGIPLEKVIGQALYAQFPRNWDSEAKLRIESEYQISVVEQPENMCGFCGIPDGAFRTIMCPVAVCNVRPVLQWIQRVVEESPLTYPITVEAKLVFQAVNFLEGKAPAWTGQEAVSFHRSVMETGLVPYGLPQRELANDGSAAWTLRRDVYFLFIGLPFAGLTDFLDRMVSANGPVRFVSDPELRIEFRPAVVPAALEMQTESVALWDRARTTRSFMQFARTGEATVVPTIEELIEAERNAPATLAKVEAVSGEVVARVEQILRQGR